MLRTTRCWRRLAGASVPRSAASLRRTSLSSSCSDRSDTKGKAVGAAQVHKALCKPLSEVVAIKLLDLENVDCSLVRSWQHD